MKFSAQEEYGLRCMVAIAREGDGGFMTIPSIAKAEGMTQSHVAKLLAILRRAEFVKSTRGQLGGYTLSRPSDDIIIKDLLGCLGGRLFDEGFCERYSGVLDTCVHNDECRVGMLWSEIQTAVDKAIENKTLKDVVESSPVCNVQLHKNGRPTVEVK